MFAGDNDENNSANIAQIPPPPAYDENDSNRQNVQTGYAMPTPLVPLPIQGGRHCTADAQDVALLQRNTRNVDDVRDVDSFICWNVFAFLCCCWPIGLVGLIFSLLSYHAKSKGYREDALWCSLIARILCGCSVIVLGVVIAIAIQIDIHYFHFLWLKIRYIRYIINI